jgi:hypothetical protein
LTNSWRNGFNCIATAGSGGKIKFHKGIKKILLCFDGDDQGRDYIEKYVLDFYEQGADVVRFLITKDGIFTGTREQISFEPIFISRCGINHQNGVEYVELSFNSNGNTKRRIVDRNIISSIGELIKESKYGAPVNSGNAQIARFCIYAGFASIVWDKLNFSPVIMENFGHGIEHFVLNYLNLKDEFKKPESFMPSAKINSLSNAERRILKQLAVIYFTGLVINEIFKFNFPVLDECKVEQQYRGAVCS